MGAGISVSEKMPAAVARCVDDSAITLDDLPPADTKRWVIRRKAEVVAAVRAGVITLEEACQRYTLSSEEFLSWQRLIERHGVRGLRATRLQDYRKPEETRRPPPLLADPPAPSRRGSP